MSRLFKCAVRYLLFYNIILVSHKCWPGIAPKINESERILALASNGELVAVALSTKIIFYSIISNISHTLLADLLSVNLEHRLDNREFEFELLTNNRFVLCATNTCKLYKINTNAKEAHVSLVINTGFSFTSWASIVLDNKLLINFLRDKPHNALLLSYDLSSGRKIGEAGDHVSVGQFDALSGFKRGSYSYFVSTVYEPDIYSSDIRTVPANVTRTRLVRVCNNDNSKDLVTRMNIHLACGKDPNDYTKIPTFNFHSSYLSADSQHLFVMFDAKKSGFLLCSYTMAEIDRYFDAVWNSCQEVEDKDKFQDECLNDPIYCSYSWMRSSFSSSINCERFGRSFTKKKYSNCESADFSPSISRFGWIENFWPLWGKLDSKYSSNQKIAGLDAKTFMVLSERHQLKRLLIGNPSSSPLWNQTVDKFSTVKPGINHSSYIIYATNNEIRAQELTCAALYPNCSAIRWDDPLQCSYCAFSNSSGYVTQLSASHNQTCIQSKGKIVVNQCPPTIQKVTIVNGQVTIVGDALNSFLNPRVLVCEDECEIKRLMNNVILCEREEAATECDVKVNGDLISTNDYMIYFTNHDYDNLNTDDYDWSTSGKGAGRTTKFVVGIVAAVFFIAVIGLIGYIITNKRCTTFQHGEITSVTKNGFANRDLMRGLDSIALPDAYNTVSTTEPPDSSLELYGITVFPDYHLIEKVQTIGRGNFAIVYKYRYKTPPYKEIAVKEIADGDMREVKLIAQCRHPNIVEYFGYFRNGNNVCLVMEYLGGGDLHKYLINRENHFTCQDGFDIVLQIAEGMRYLADNDIIHRDLAARNCMMSGDRRVIKITDFGLGRKTNLDGMYEPMDPWTKLPFRWTALECLKGNPFTEKSDVWSYGIVMWEVFSRCKMPYPEIKTNKEIQDLLETGQRPHHPGEGCPNELYNVMLSCWTAEPNDRPTFAQLHTKMQAVIDALLNDSTVDYYSVYLTPRTSTFTDANQSTPTIMEDSNMESFVGQKNASPAGHVSIS